MYRKYMSLLLLFSAVLAISFGSVKGIEFNRVMAAPAFRLEAEGAEETEESEVKCLNYLGILTEVSSGQRVVDCKVLEREYVYDIDDADYDALLRIVEAEAGCEDEKGKLLVANVVLNRLKDEQFPDTIEGVILQKENGTTQFSPVANGRFYSVKVSEETIEVVNRALCGEDISKGALYFAARKYADPNKMKWFDHNLTFLFEYGGHEFFS